MSRSVGEDYLLALGRFVHTFSQVEGWAQHLLREYARTDPHTSRALFSGVRLKDATSDLNFDLNLIIVRLRHFVINENPYVGAEHKSQKSAYPHYWQTPWRYKPVQQAQPQRKTPRRDKARRRPQKSSPQ
jgi:hypothetical protein